MFINNLQKMTCCEDFRRIAKRKMPKMFYEYTDSGSWTQSTYRANANAYSDIKFRQLVARDLSNRSTEVTMLGEKVTMPVALAPTGLTGMHYADGEILAARAAHNFGIPFTLSTMSICSIEDVAANTDKPFWFQLYVMKDKQFLANIIRRAQEAQCSALMITLDLQVLGQRHKDIKNGLSTPPKPTIANLLNLALKPRWCWYMAQTKRHSFGNIIGHVKNVSDTRSLAAWTAEQFDPTLSWQDVAKIKELWGGKLILKGIMDAEDAKLAVANGADAIIVSNHGGRQLDGAAASLHALEAIVAAVGKETEVWLDGGITSGQDVLKAWALGARGTLIGRAFLYALAAYGQSGVEKLLSLMHNELDVSMAFCGERHLQHVKKDILLTQK